MLIRLQSVYQVFCHEQLHFFHGYNVANAPGSIFPVMGIE